MSVMRVFMNAVCMLCAPTLLGATTAPVTVAFLEMVFCAMV